MKLQGFSGLSGAGFSLWGLVFARTKIRRLKPAPLEPSVTPAGIRRAATTAGGGSRAGGGSPIRGFSRAKHGELQSVTLARALRTFDLLGRGHHDAFVARLAIVADVFVNRHIHSLQINSKELQQIMD
jgi:hypothetical protein